MITIEQAMQEKLKQLYNTERAIKEIIAYTKTSKTVNKTDQAIHKILKINNLI